VSGGNGFGVLHVVPVMKWNATMPWEVSRYGRWGGLAGDAVNAAGAARIAAIAATSSHPRITT
jgi:hypothetical protein